MCIFTCLNKPFFLSCDLRPLTEQKSHRSSSLSLVAVVPCTLKLGVIVVSVSLIHALSKTFPKTLIGLVKGWRYSEQQGLHVSEGERNGRMEGEQSTGAGEKEEEHLTEGRREKETENN